MDREEKNNEDLIKLGEILLKSYFGGIRPVLVRPELNDITGGFLSSAIFERILYMSTRYKKIWMYITPSKYEDYIEGKSFCEILNISQYRFNNALKKFAFKLGKTQNTIKKKEALVFYYKGNDNKTYFEVNGPLAKLKMGKLYKSGKFNSLEMPVPLIPKGNLVSSIPKGIPVPLIPNTNESLKKIKKESINNNKLRQDSKKSPDNEYSSLTNLGKNTPKSVKFNYGTGKWNNVTKEYRAEMEARFPDIDLDKEFGRMRDWLIDHAKRPKENFLLFITDWLEDSQTRKKKGTMEESLEEMEEEEELFDPDSRVNLREELEDGIFGPID